MSTNVSISADPTQPPTFDEHGRLNLNADTWIYLPVEHPDAVLWCIQLAERLREEASRRANLQTQAIADLAAARAQVEELRAEGRIR